MADSKSSKDSLIPAEVNELIQESQKIHGWIEKLAELRDETTPAVYERVHTDYRARLAEVTSRLAEHQSALSETLEKRRAEVEKLRAERDEQAADLEEAKLRFAVGEYGSDQWDERRERIERGLQSLKDRLSSEDAALEELEAILASIPAEEGATAAIEVKQTPGWMAEVQTEEPSLEEVSARVEEVSAQVDVEAPAAKEETEEEAKQAPPTVPRTKADELAKPGASAAEEVVPGPDAEGGEKEGEEGEYLDELEFLESLSLEESDRFDAVSAMLDDEEGRKGGSE